MIEVEFNLLKSALWQIFKCLDSIAIVAIVFDNTDDLVINFAIIMTVNAISRKLSDISLF